MKRPEELSHMLTEMYNDTKDGKIRWNRLFKLVDSIK